MAGSREWRVVIDELDRWRAAGRTARLWLRDDDAIAPTPALEGLLRRLKAVPAPALIAVIPMRASRELADRLLAEPLVTIAMHGAWHANHCPPERKSEETPEERGLDAIVPELDAARRRLVGLFGEAAGAWYVPPWNRIGAAVAARLPGLGFRILSIYGAPRFALAPQLAEVNTHVDVIDWRGGRIGRPGAAVAADLAAALARARAAGWSPVGVLTHHLVHDHVAWETLDAMLDLIAAHPAAAWIAPDVVAAAA